MLKARRLIAATTVIALPATGLSAARADIVVPVGRPCGHAPAGAGDRDTRLGLIRTANTYPQFMIEHDSASLRIAPDVIRVENGRVTARTAQDICDTLPYFLGETDLDKRWFTVSRKGWVTGFFAVNELSVPTYFAARFRVRDGRIERQDEVVYAVDAASPVDSSDNGATTLPASALERLWGADDVGVLAYTLRKRLGDVRRPGTAAAAVVREAARSYLTAFKTGNASRVPLDDQAIRVENHRVRGRSAAEIREQLAASSMSVTALHDLTIDVEGDTAVAMYKFDWDGTTAATNAVFLAFDEYWAATRFRVRRGLITEIESICAGQAGRNLYCGDSATGAP